MGARQQEFGIREFSAEALIVESEGRPRQAFNRQDLHLTLRPSFPQVGLSFSDGKLVSRFFMKRIAIAFWARGDGRTSRYFQRLHQADAANSPDVERHALAVRTL
jgi:hypothetical protein